MTGIVAIGTLHGDTQREERERMRLLSVQGGYMRRVVSPMMAVTW
jgi:hypothetical protein